jgi:hypothetical protein
LIHPGEEQRLQSQRKHQQRLAEKRQQFNQRAADWDQQLAERRGAASTDTWGIDKTRKVETQKKNSRNCCRVCSAGRLQAITG